MGNMIPKGRTGGRQSTDLQTGLCAVRLLGLPRRVLGTTLSTDGFALSTRHFGRVLRREGVESASRKVLKW